MNREGGRANGVAERLQKRAAVALGLMILRVGVHATGFTNLYNFGSGLAAGAAPYGTPVMSDGTLFGTTSSRAAGTVFAISTNGTGFTNLYVFGGANDGANPEAGLLLSGNTLFGTTLGGGTNSSGTIFRINTSGAAFSNLYSFSATSGPLATNGDGQGPQAGLVSSGVALYGVAGGGGGGGNGTVFRLNTDGSGFANLHNFGVLTFGGGAYTNSDGADPQSGLLLSGDTLFGTTSSGGTNGGGTLFAINTNGTGFTNLHTFGSIALANTNSDGANPQGGLVMSGGALYGTTRNGGLGGYGGVFQINTNGTGFTSLYSFTKLSLTGTNHDGANPEATLLLSAGALYGTTYSGGGGGSGTVFKLNADGTAFTVLHSFTDTTTGAAGNTNLDGAGPSAGLLLAGTSLYGTAALGGLNGFGTVFAVSALTPIPLNVQRMNQALVLSWTDPNYSLQAASTVFGSFTNLSGATSPYTNTLAGSQRYFRLRSN